MLVKTIGVTYLRQPMKRQRVLLVLFAAPSLAHSQQNSEGDDGDVEDEASAVV